MQLKFNPYIALAAAVVGAVAVDQVAKKAAPTDPKKQQMIRLGTGAAALAGAYFYGDYTTKAIIMGVGVGGLLTESKMVQEKLLQPVQTKLLKA